ncbi:MAG: preprotein translocase subunit Sec61beta [archaeon]
MKFKKSNPLTGPSSAIGITRYFDSDSAGPKMSPEFIVGLCIAIIAVLLVLHLMS